MSMSEKLFYFLIDGAILKDMISGHVEWKYRKKVTDPVCHDGLEGDS